MKIISWYNKKVSNGNQDVTKQLPIFHNPDVTRCEPFVLPNYYRPPAIPEKYGVTHRSWVTTAPSWFLKAVAEGMFGVCVGDDGVRMAPALPKAWKHAFLRCRIRGATYEIDVRKRRGSRGVASVVRLNGQPLPNGVVPFQPEGSTHRIEVDLFQ